ncbi:phosphatidylinositol kinase [Subtercola boreus]|uniref:Phosphatidylinositol kinase n=1 Tax=Subtercola boreus TaxID=120213 RepID=A0A3E0VKZ0_9MICO|nr:SCO1664 family protein [Subtercola boreus]RFA10305.1 phosphatidylinositol kinase [Subtercola boreus]TQL56191.1 putative repeat protein (TIGR03843 family) [Subtercola boreus]
MSGALPSDGELELTGRITTASNATFLAQLGDLTVVYKPISGEKPLWDFPDGNLAHREVAAHLVSESFGWNVVPRTWLGDGPLGPGMLQLWQDVDEAQDAVDLVSWGTMPETGWRHVFDGRDEHDHPVSLIHEDSAELRRMAVFDVVTNNADRKGNHILPMPGGHRYGVDHGLTFHEEHKLRTVLWGFIGDELLPAELEGVQRVRDDLDWTLGEALVELITDRERRALRKRCDRLLQTGKFPGPRGQMPAVPWPLF